MSKFVKIYELILTFFYVGKIKKAPGTFGSVAGVLLWFLIDQSHLSIIDLLFSYKDGLDIIFYLFFVDIFINLSWLIFVILLVIIGSLMVKSYSKKFKTIDHKSIVLDEVVGQIITIQLSLFMLGFFRVEFVQNSLHYFVFLLLSFLLFRFFDIYKPFLIGYVDKKIKNGFGVFLDDILAGVFSAITIILIFYLSAILGFNF